MVLGDAEVTVLNVGDITLPLSTMMRQPSDARDPDSVLSALARQVYVPMQDVLVRRGGEMFLVDAGRYDVSAESEYAIPGYEPPFSIVAQLQAMGVSTRDVQHVIITHRHWDHFNGTTRFSKGEWVPTFPNARYHIGRSDWDAGQAARRDAGSLEGKTLAALDRAGAIALVDTDTTIAQGVTIQPSPGETPGHQIVRFDLDGGTIYAVGDMYHHPIELANPEWMVRWADQELNICSRNRFIKEATRVGSFAVASHIRGVGRISGTPECPLWTSAA